MPLPEPEYTSRNARKDRIKAYVLFAFGIGMIWAMFSRPADPAPRPPSTAGSHR